jgi:hypothetical protein
MTSNICNARKRTLLGTYICDLAPGHETDHEDVAQHHSWLNEGSWTNEATRVANNAMVVIYCMVAAATIVLLACWGGAR